VLNKKKNRVAQKFLDARGNIFIKFYWYSMWTYWFLEIFKVSSV
jgi:hypothetical protein